MVGKISATVRLDGFRELDKALEAIGPKNAKKVGHKAMREAGEILVDEAKVRVPVLTGELEDSITYIGETTNALDALKGVVGFKKPASRRAHLTEYGTVHSAPQPFMRPAFDASREAMIARMGKVIWDGCVAEARKAPKGRK